MPRFAATLGFVPAVVAAHVLGWSAPVAAHPHVWVVTQTTLVFENGVATAIEHKWTFDEMYSAMATQGLDKNNDKKLDRDELAELAKVNMEGLKEFGYFTHPSLDGQAIKVGEATNAYLQHADGILSLHFRLPMATPVLPEAKGFGYQVYDPSFFIAFDLAKDKPASLSQGAPENCKLEVLEPPTGSSEQRLSEAFSATLGAQAGATSFAKLVKLTCGEAK